MNVTPIADINITDRMRADLGDIEALAKSLDEFGLIQPVVIDQSGKLIAGGRRLAAAKLLGWTSIKTVPLETLDEPHRRELELEENVRRKDLTWQEHVTAVSDIHKLKVQLNNVEGRRWGTRQTGELLGISLGNVSYCLQVADELRKPGSHTRVAKNMTEALRILMKDKEDEALKKLSDYTLQAPSVVQGEQFDLTQDLLADEARPQAGAGVVPELIPLNRMLFLGDCLEVMNKTLEAGSIDHVVTDPPYGIDMENLEQTNTGMVGINTVSAEHDVENNLVLFTKLFTAVFRVLKPNGFFVLWYDLDHHEKLQALALAAGFKVQRWPLVWLKTHKCLNQAAQWNFTKTCEYAMVCRKGNATLVEPQAYSHFLESNDTDRRMYDHPFVKPFAVWKWIFSAVALKGQTILDPFAGVGSSSKTALNCGYVPIAIESNQAHFSRLVQNISELYKLFTRGKSQIVLPDVKTP